MTTNPEPRNESTPHETGSIAMLGARLTWVIVGPLALLMVTLGIVSRGDGWLTILDVLFGVLVGAMFLGRWMEQRSGTALTIAGQPATVAQFKRYTALLLVCGSAVWATANLLGNHVLTRA